MQQVDIYATRDRVTVDATWRPVDAVQRSDAQVGNRIAVQHECLERRRLAPSARNVVRESDEPTGLSTRRPRNCELVTRLGGFCFRTPVQSSCRSRPSPRPAIWTRAGTGKTLPLTFPSSRRRTRRLLANERSRRPGPRRPPPSSSNLRQQAHRRAAEADRHRDRSRPVTPEDPARRADAPASTVLTLPASAGSDDDQARSHASLARSMQRSRGAARPAARRGFARDHAQRVIGPHRR